MPRSKPTGGHVKLTGRLKDLAEIRKKPTVLLGDVQAHLLKKADAPSDRRSDCLHPSEMSHDDWCPRRSYFTITGAPATEDGKPAFSFVRENIFEQGHDIHARWQGWLRDMGVLWGKWHCDGCGVHYLGLEADFPHDGCDYVGSKVGGHTNIVYREVPLEVGLIAGHADGAVPDKGALIEIKSIGLGTVRFENPELLARYEIVAGGRKLVDFDGLWKELRTPFPSHLRQANLYLWLAAQMGLPFTQMIFIYESKMNQQVKEFVVKASPRIVERKLELAGEVERAVERKVPPARPRDVSPDSGICKGCPFNAVCWGHPAAAALTAPIDAEDVPDAA
ncbi:hypothetical protein [Actinomadura atramentaria]|uniref:hypothetical protein n=1 Tax=Actinomadura atramentaria TaxID=1990 RepID=UPI00035C5D8F|nr:hypothetical protein [Actinomadura atramentaria]